MKSLLIALALALGSQFVIADMPKGETKKVCVDQKDKAGKPIIEPKTNQPKQPSKMVRQHKKLDVEKK